MNKSFKATRLKNYFSKIKTDAEVLDFSRQSNFTHLLNPLILNYYLNIVSIVKQLDSKIKKKIKILDWGGGIGILTFLLKKEKFDVEICEFPIVYKTEDEEYNKKNLIHSFYNEYQDIFIRESDSKIKELNHDFKIPYEKDSFDIVISAGTLEHVIYPEKSLCEINRILKKDGFFCCFNFVYYFSWSQRLANIFDKGHDKLFTKKEIFAMLKKVKFSIKDFFFSQFLPYSIPFFSKLKYFFPTNFYQKLDTFFCNYTPLKYFSTAMNFVVQKREDLES